MFNKSLSELTFFDLLTIIGLGLMIFCVWWLLLKKGGLRELKKMWLDTTTNKATGDYSQKRLMMWFAFWPAVAICFTQAFTIKLHPIREFNSNPNTPFWAPLLLFLIALGATAAVLLGHFNARKITTDKGAPLTPPYTEPVAEPLLATASRSKPGQATKKVNNTTNATNGEL